MNEFSKDAESKIQKSVAFDTLVKSYQKRNKNNSIKIILKIKCLGIYFTKEVKALYSENYKTLMKD